MADLAFGSVGNELVDAVSFAFGRFCEIPWALILGFALSAVVQAVVSKDEAESRVRDSCTREIGLEPC